jgi:catechol 2,3-dioxygenase-like lactoylglutathione lyase family enzyme
MGENTNSEFALQGLNHVALVCEDMERTVDFYTNVMGMKLTKTIDLPGGTGQHFFFDMGRGQALAFFWFTEAKDRQPGISNPRKNFDPEVVFSDPDALTSSHGSMNHLAFDVSPEKFDEYHQKLVDKGINVSPIMRHDTSPTQMADEVTESVWVSSLYFQDPDGIVLEFACWHRPFDQKLGDRWDHKPATPADKDKYRQMGEEFAAQLATAS